MPASQTTLDPHTSGPLAVASGGPSPRAGTAAAPGPATQKPTTKRRPFSKGALRLVSPAIVLVIWQLASEFGLISTQRLPPPTQVWSTAVSLVTTNSSAYGTLQGAMLVSLERVAAGFAVGAVTAVLLALAAGLSRFGETAVDPLMQMLRTLPLFGLIPVFIVWFGIGQTPKILLIAIATATRIGTAFYAFGLILLSTLSFLGFVTLDRVLQSGIEELHYVERIARLRAYYYGSRSS